MRVSSLFQQISRGHIHAISLCRSSIKFIGPAFKELHISKGIYLNGNHSIERYWPLFKYSIRHEMTPTITKQPQSEPPKMNICEMWILFENVIQFDFMIYLLSYDVWMLYTSRIHHWTHSMQCMAALIDSN